MLDENLFYVRVRKYCDIDHSMTTSNEENIRILIKIDMDGAVLIRPSSLIVHSAVTRPRMDQRTPKSIFE